MFQRGSYWFQWVWIQLRSWKSCLLYYFKEWDGWIFANVRLCLLVEIHFWKKLLINFHFPFYQKLYQISFYQFLQSWVIEIYIFSMYHLLISLQNVSETFRFAQFLVLIESICFKFFMRILISYFPSEGITASNENWNIMCLIPCKVNHHKFEFEIEFLMQFLYRSFKWTTIKPGFHIQF